MLRVSSYFNRTITIDGEPVQVRVKRFNREEQIAFATSYDFINREQAAFDSEVRRFGRRHLAAVAAERGVDVEALPRDERLDDVQLIGLFEATLTTEDRDARRAREQALAQRGSAFTVQCISDYITVEPGQIVDDDSGREVLSGADLAGYFMAREQDVLVSLMAAIVEENRLSPDQKKIYASLRASAAISPRPATTDGPRPAGTADAVAPSTIARPGPATAHPSPSQSGATTASSATGAPSSALPPTSKRRSRGSTPRTRSPLTTASRASDAPASPALAGSPTRTRD